MTEPSTPDAAPPTREELVALVAHAHHGAPYAECKHAGAALAAQSKLPRLIAENLGAGFGQWTFFPEPSAVVDFACAYAPPDTAEEMWALCRRWAEDDAASRHTVLSLVGRELMLTELRRVDVPELRAFFAEPRGASALALRKSLGLDMPPVRSTKAAAKREESASEAASGGSSQASTAPADGLPAPAAPPPRSAAKARREPKTIDGPMKMPRPVLTRAKKEPPPPPRHFEHPKFGAGVLEKLDGTGDDAKLTIRFESGTKTLLAKFVTEMKVAEAELPLTD